MEIWGTFESWQHKYVTERMKQAMTGRNAEMGLYNGDPTYCTVNAYGACPYCDQMGICHIDDPIRDCDEFQMFFESWDDWLKCDDTPETDWDYNEDAGFDPYMGEYTYDC